MRIGVLGRGCFEEESVDTELKSGRKLDALIAEKVMGWSLDQLAAECGIYRGWPSKGDAIHRPALPILYYSTSISAAWEVVEKMMSGGFRFVFSCEGEKSHAHFFNDDQEVPGATQFYAVGETAPLAVCLAALKLVEGRNA